VQDFAAILGDAIRHADEPVCVLAGADLSHVGPRFGDACRLEADFMAQVERRDRQLLAHVERNDPAAMLAHLRREQNPTRICSSGCLVVALSALPQAKVELLCYDQAVTPEIQTAVTCAALALTA
jgi:AmmeMemoRadiSam system protein B